MKKMKAYAQIADELNEKGILPSRARKFTAGTVYQAVMGNIDYPVIRNRFNELMAENGKVDK